MKRDDNTYLKDIVDYWQSHDAVRQADGFVNLWGRKHQKQTTAGWQLCVAWKDGSTSWERLSNIKDSYPVEAGEYAVSQGIDHELAFAWWVPYVLGKHNRLIAAIKNKWYHKQMHQFGHEVPKTVADAQ